MIVDTFPFHDELDILEMRLVELYDVVDAFVIVEANVTHQDVAKPSYFMESRERFDPWADKIVTVWAEGLPTIKDDPDPWARELAQREHIATGLAKLAVPDSAIILQSDVDEIPRPLHVRNVRPINGFAGFHQRGHFWAVDWLYPPGWNGTVAGTAAAIQRLHENQPFGAMRSMRNMPSLVRLPDAGWHFSWLGGPDRALAKVDSFCHPEVEDDIRGSIANDNFYWREGFHVDGVKLQPVDIDESWPEWIKEGNAPDSWFRPK